LKGSEHTRQAITTDANPLLDVKACLAAYLKQREDTGSIFLFTSRLGSGMTRRAIHNVFENAAIGSLSLPIGQLYVILDVFSRYVTGWIATLVGLPALLKQTIHAADGVPVKAATRSLPEKKSYDDLDSKKREAGTEPGWRRPHSLVR
jgi:hypothetical protein